MSSNIKSIELALVTGRWDDKIPSDDNTIIGKYAKDVVDGSFRSVLTCPRARAFFTVRSSPSWEFEQPLSTWFTFGGGLDAGTEAQEGKEEENELFRLILAVACLHAFVQANWTGPDLDVSPLDVLVFPSASSSQSSSATDDVGVSEEALNRKATWELAYGGEPAYHLARVSIFLRLAELLLGMRTHKFCRSVGWWRVRIWIVRQQVLDEPVALSSDLLSELLGESSLDEIKGDAASFDSDIKGRILLEQGLLHHTLSNDRSAGEYFVKAARAMGLEYELTGALGKRTKFQQTDISQLVLLAQSRARTDKEGGKVDDNRGYNRETTFSKSTGLSLPETLALNDDTLLERTEFTSSDPNSESRLSYLDPNSQPPLHPLDQCVLLALCLNVKNTSPAHGLTSEQMSPYVSRVISHPLNWSIHTMALLLRSRLEAHRTRTVERSALQLQALVDQMSTADSSISERLLYFHSIPLPSKWEMEKELALRFMSIGVTKSALEIFERLEMWEEVVKCWHSMERRDKGIAIVRDLLEGRKAEADAVISRGKASSRNEQEKKNVLHDAAREAKLWCLLGDLEPDHALEHYTRAWEVSKSTSGRAMRSLGGYHFARGDYLNTVECLRRAVAINPLLPRSWFILGCAYVRQEDWEGAREAFTRCVAIDDEDGESWNNLSTVYLRMGENVNNRVEDQVSDETQMTIPFTNKMMAYRALKQGVKHGYDNWRMWTNYMIVCVDVGELSEACRALSRVVELRSNQVGSKCVDEDVLDKLVDAVTRLSAQPEEPGNTESNLNAGHGLMKMVNDLFERMILPRVSSPRIFKARGRLLTLESRWGDAIKTYLDAYRSGAGGLMERGETDANKWKEGVREVEEIVDILRNFGPREDGFNWLLQAKSIVRTFMGKTKESFEDELEWAKLAEIAEELKY